MDPELHDAPLYLQTAVWCAALGLGIVIVGSIAQIIRELVVVFTVG